MTDPKKILSSFNNSLKDLVQKHVESGGDVAAMVHDLAAMIISMHTSTFCVVFDKSLDESQEGLDHLIKDMREMLKHAYPTAVALKKAADLKKQKH